MPDTAEDAAIEIRLESTQRFAREDVEPDRDQRSMRRIENAMRRRNADQLVADIIARAAQRHDLHILAEGIQNLAVARDDFCGYCGEVDQPLAGKLVHSRDEIGK